MKKIFLGLALVASTVSFAQLQFGAKAGFGLSSMNEKTTVSGITAEVSGVKPTFYAGGLVEYKINKLGLQGEVLYTQLGGNTELTIMGVPVDTRVTIHSLLVPVMAKYYIIDNAFSVGAGINLGANLGSNAVAKNTLSGRELESDITDKIAPVSVLPLVNVEYKLPMGLFFDTRYNFGVMNLNRNSLGNSSLKSGQWQIGLGYRF